MRKKRTTQERYGKGYSDYVRVYKENVKTHAHKTDKRAIRTLQPMLSETAYIQKVEVQWKKLEKKNKAIDKENERYGKNEPHEVIKNMNKRIIDDQSFELSEKQGKVLQKVMGKQLAEEKYIKKLKKEHPELSMDEMERMAASADLKPEYVPLSWVRAGEQLSESKFKESISEFWDDVSSERRSKMEEYMAQGYSRSEASKMASKHIAVTNFDSDP